MRFVALVSLVLLSACAGVPPPVPPDPVPVAAPTVPVESSIAQAPEPVTMCQLPFGKYSRGEKFQGMTCPVYKQAIAKAVAQSTSPDLWFCWVMDECFFWEHEQGKGK